jgi:hypothetical protein
LCTVAAFAWQWLVVAGVFQGHWSALFVEGDRFPQSPVVRSESTFVLPNSAGYDAQFYHAIAHDPLDLHATDRFVGSPRFRYTRILIPGLSFLLGGGKLFWIDRAYRGLELMFLFLGVFCTAALLERSGRSCWWGALFLALPATFISVERQLTDLPACALLAAALLAVDRERNGWAWLALAAGALNRETGVVILVGFVLLAVWERKWKQAAWWITATLPVVAWAGYLWLAVPSAQPEQLGLSNSAGSLMTALRHPQSYDHYAAPAAQALHFLDLLGIAGAFCALAWGLLACTRARNHLTMVALALAVFGVLISPGDEYYDVYTFGRYKSPLLLLQVLQALRTFDPKLFGPLAAILPRALIPGASLTLRALRGLLLR